MFSRGSSTKSASGLPASLAAQHQANRAAAASSSAHPLSLCADCGASGPAWVSVNRGVLLCADCAAVHRSLGRHVSHVKSLRGGQKWIPEQLTMVQSLYSCGANSIWEYSLLNPGAAQASSSSSSLAGEGGKSGGGSSSGGRAAHRKPAATDPVHPVKSDFIAAKYRDLAFVYRPAKDEPAVTAAELSRQLHSSVRTPNLETSLRLLSQGADPNYYHPEKDSSPLQVAAKAGQAGQVELLLVYGADPGAADRLGRTASDYATASGNAPLATRIAVARYELSDRLSSFLLQRRPDHAAGEHFLVPEVRSGPGETAAAAECRRVAKRKLQGLSNGVFEELAVDVYDEVDRRETDEVWARLEPSSKAAVLVPFLPVNPEYGTTRNQGRQKLARMSRQEFSVLIADVLKEIRRRQQPMDNGKLASPLRESPLGLRGAAKLSHTKSLPPSQHHPLMAARTLSAAASEDDDDEPIYDHVASDDDYGHLPEIADRPQSSSGPSTATTGAGGGPGSSLISSPSKSHSSASGRVALAGTTAASRSVLTNEYTALKAQLESSEEKVQRLIESNDDMRTEIARLSVTVSKLVSENETLKKKNMSPTHGYANAKVSNGGGSGIAANNAMMRSDSIPYADNNARRGSPVSRTMEPRNSFTSGSSQPPTNKTTTSYKTLPNRQLPARSSSSNENNNASSSELPHTLQFFEPYDYDVPPPSYKSVQHYTGDQYRPSGGGGGDGGESGNLPFALSSSSSPGPPPPPAPTSAAQQSEYMGATSRPSTGATSSSASASSGETSLPSQEEVVRRTEAITRCIQELLISVSISHVQTHAWHHAYIVFLVLG